MTALAQKKIEFPTCPECGANAWTIIPESCGLELGLTDEGKWYLLPDWVDGFDANCSECDHYVEVGSDLEQELIPYLIF